MTYKIVKVSQYRRKGRFVSGHNRRQKIDRGKFQTPRKIRNLNKTMWLKERGGRFIGRKRVEGRGDLTGIFREQKGRIIGRTKAG